MTLPLVFSVLDRRDDRAVFWCPGCNEEHALTPDIWSITGTDDKPTVYPSVLMTSGHYVRSHKQGDTCWCTYNKANPEKRAPFACTRCHSFVKEGKIEFLNDSTHHLAGQTVPLPPYKRP